MADKDEMTEDEQERLENMPLAVENIEYTTGEIKRDVDSVKSKVGGLEEDVAKIKRNVEAFRSETPSYWQIAILVMGCSYLVGTCDNNAQTDKITQAIANSHQVQRANVLGAEAPEKFYDIDGQRVYLEIDGKPVAEYLKGRQ